jgi:hypothetical protein
MVMAKSRIQSKPSFVICIDNSEYPASLELHKVYKALHDSDAARDGDLRVIDESGEDYLYPAQYFLPIQVPREKARTLSRALGRTARASHKAA